MASIAIYSVRTNRVRRIISSDDLSLGALLRLHPGGTGEAAIQVLDGSVVTSQQLLIDLNGIVPRNDRYCAVRGRIVVHTFVGDLDCGDSAHSHAGTSLVVNDRARLGWRQLNDRSLARSLEEVRAAITIEEERVTALKRQSPDVDRTQLQIDTKVEESEDELGALRAEEARR